MLSLNALNDLRTQLRSQMVLSVYIAAEEHSPAERVRWRLRLQQQLDAVAAASGRDRGFARARAIVEKELQRYRGFLPGSGWVAFATADRLWSCEEVPAPMPDIVRWRQGIVLAPYLRALKQTRPVVLALVDSKRARLFRYVAGSTIEPIDYRADTFIDDLTDRNMSKRAATYSGTRGETATDAAERMLELETERMLKQVAAIVRGRAGRDGLVVVGGPTQPAHALHELLSDALGERLMLDESAFLMMSDTAARETIERCASQLSNELQAAVIADLVNAAGTTGRATIRLSDTAAAATFGQVEDLLLTPRFIRDYDAEAEALIDAVLERGGRVQEVGDVAAALLEEYGEGVAARLRFAVSPVTETVPAD